MTIVVRSGRRGDEGKQGAAAISTPTDIVMDVLKAADPAAVREARLALQAGSPASPAQPRSASDVAAATEAFDRAFGAERRAGLRTASALPSANDVALHDSYRSFEAMVLQIFVKSMLPSDAEEFFGKGTAGEIWKGMMAEQLGTMIAKGGGVGIADYLSNRNATLGAEGQVVHASLDGNQRNLAGSLLHELQRETLQDWSARDTDRDKG